MALIECPECGREISDKSKICINCGFPIFEWLEENKKIEEKNKLQEQEHIALKEKFFCRCCNKQNDIGSDYCEFCGIRLTSYTENIRTEYNEFAERLVEEYPTKKKVDIVKEFSENMGTSISFANQIIEMKIQESGKQFNGIYRYTLFGEKQEVFCPRCHGGNCSHYKEQRIIPSKSKSQYVINLNPLKPFTLVNKKEKIIREEKYYTKNKIICNDCGKIF